MLLQLKVSNIGTAPLTNLRMTSSYPIEYTIALQGSNAIQPNLNVGASNVIEWNNANSCTSDAQCGTSERCIDSSTLGGEFCLMDISNFLGEITFGAELSADFVDAQGVPDTTTTTINLPILFEQDAVIFRTSNLNYDSGWIAVDVNNDGNLDGFGYASSTTRTYSSNDFLTFTPNGYGAYKDSDTKIYVTLFEVTDKNSDQSGSGKIYLSDLGGSAVTSNIPTEPYLSANCGGISPCQERYSIAVAQAEQTCYDGVKNQDETDVDCGGSICGACGLDKVCSEDSDCLSGTCSGNLCVGEEEPTENPNDGKTVVWRTGITNCVFDSWRDSSDKWVAFDNDNEIQTSLKEYGWTSTWSGSSRNSDDFPWFTALGGTSPCGYSIDAYSDQIYALNIQGDNDAKFDEDVSFADPGQLSVDPCCGFTCGVCCERYSDGTSNC